MNHMEWAIDTPPDAMMEHYNVRLSYLLRCSLLMESQVNVVGPLVLFQATYPLLKASTSTPKFIGISTVAGSTGLGATFPLKGVPYGASKSALNYTLRKLRYENDGLSVWCSLVIAYRADAVDYSRLSHLPRWYHHRNVSVLVL
jgi:NAD(P)-dependent dehydrogenase (short-subunit alcohol dehydrogenase family)